MVYSGAMRIAVYCSSSPDVAPAYLQLGHDLGMALGKKGHDLVWGGGAISVMGTVAVGVRESGGKTIGVIPEKLMSVEFVDHLSDELHVVSDMRERKGKIESLADGFITLPGGLGTLEEFFEIWVGRYLGFHLKPIAVLDPFGAYTSLRSSLDDLTEMNFIKPGMHELVEWCSDIPSAINAMESFGLSPLRE